MSLPDGGGDSNFSVTPGELCDVSTDFYKAASDTFDLQSSLTTEANQLISQMSSVLSQSPASLQRFFSLWSNSVENLGNSLDSVGWNLYEAGTGYQDADSGANKSLQIRPQHGPF